jgi:hypothetical protein
MEKERLSEELPAKGGESPSSKTEQKRSEKDDIERILA